MTRTASQDGVDARRAERRARAEELRSKKGAEQAALRAASAAPASVPVPPARPRVAGKGQLSERHKERLRDIATALGMYQIAAAELESAQILALNDGVPAAAVARALGISPQAVHQRVSRWQEEQQ